MKKYVVLQQIGNFTPDVKEFFDELEDANAFVELMSKTHPTRKYRIFSIMGKAL